MALRFDVDTSQIKEALKELKTLRTEVGNINTAIKETNKVQKEQTATEAKANKEKEASAKAVKKQLDFITQLEQKIKDIVEGYSRSEAAVLKQARALKLNEEQFSRVIQAVTKLRPLISDPFDSSIGSIAAATKELRLLQNRAELAALGISMPAKNLKEYSKIAEEVYGKIAASSDNMTREQILNSKRYQEELKKEQQAYLELQRQIGNYRSAEGTNKGGNTQQVKYNKKNDVGAGMVDLYRADQANKQAGITGNTQKVKSANKEVEQEMDSHVKAMQKHQNALEKSNNKRLENYFAGQQRQIAGIKAMNAANEEEAKLRAAGYSPSAAADQSSLTAMRQKMISKIPLGISDEDRKRAMDGINAYMSEQGKLIQSNAKLGKSSKELAFAMRQVPMQITDIAVSLAGGQPPLMVMLQQGGQLKDMFGGVKEAAIGLAGGLKDALISAFALLKNPIVATIAVIGTFGAALWSALDRNEQFNKSLILMGNTAKVSLNQVKEAAASISNVTGASLNLSGNAFIELSKATGLTGESLNKITVSAINLERFGGQSLSETAKQFKALKSEPLEAMVSINKEVGFLTPELVRQAQAHVDAGNSAKASALLIAALSDSYATMGKALEENEGSTVKLWRNIKDSIVAATDAVSEFILKSQTMYSSVPDFTWYKILLDLGYKLKEYATGGVATTASATSSATSRTSSGKIGGLSGNSTGSSTGRPDEQANAVAEFTKWFRSNVESAKPKNVKADVEDMIKRAGDKLTKAEIDAARSSPAYTGISKADANKANEYKAWLKSLEDQADTGSYYSKSYYKDKNKLEGAKKDLTTDAFESAMKRLEEEQPGFKKNEKANKLLEEQEGIVKSILDDQERISKEQDKQLSDKAILNTLSEKDKFIFEAKVKAEADLARLLERANDNPKLNEEQRKSLKDALEASGKERIEKAQEVARAEYESQRSFATGWDNAYKAAKDSAEDYAKFAESAFTKATDGMADALTEFAMTGKLTFSNLADSIIRDLIRIQAKNMMVSMMGNSKSGLFGSIASWFSGSSGAASTVGPSAAAGGGSWLGTGQSLNLRANGAAYVNSFEAFANGGTFTNSIVDSVTPFKFANGAKFGVMGEAGPEAIMPLSRDSSGKLGVNVNGNLGSSSGDVNISVINTGNNLQVTDKKETVDSRGNRSIEITVSELVAKEQSRPGSSIYNSTRNSFGLRPQLVGR